MLYTILFPLVIGALGVLQNTVNKNVAQGVGMPIAILANGLVLFLCSIAFYFALLRMPQEGMPSLFQHKLSQGVLNWRILVPGILGFLIIASAPYCIERAGATKVFIGIIVAQILTSIAWDRFVEEISVTPVRLLGAGLAFIGALLAVR